MDLGNIALGLFGLYQGAKALHRGLTSGEQSEGDGLADAPVPPGRQLRGRPGGAKVKTFEVRNLDDRMRYIGQMARKGRLDPRMREFTVKLVSARCGSGWCTPEKNWRAEAETVFKGLRGKYYRYVRDTFGVDLYQHPKRTLQFGGGDCFPAGTLVLAEGHKLVAIEDLQPGQKIWGLDRWSEVQAVWSKGFLDVDRIKLNNGSTLRLTADHHVYVLTCPKHPVDRPSGPCSCPVSERIEERITVGELREGMVMPTPDRIPFGKGSQDPDRALIEGFYLSDGFSSHESDFAISGQDGCPKEGQKRAVEAICARLGIETTWHRKYITVKDRDWAQALRALGTHAPNKAAASIDLDESTAVALLRGIMADSGANTHGSSRTFTSTSTRLTLQTRLLWKMLGKTCGYAFLTDHGGLGENPIHRLYVRGENEAGKAEKLLRVVSIDRETMALPCWDITTDDHRVYLPEADVTVSQCDDATILLASALGSIGFKVKARVIQTHDADDWNHIYCLVEIPNAGGAAGREGKGGALWLPMDLSMDKPPGWEAPRSMIKRQRDYPL